MKNKSTEIHFNDHSDNRKFYGQQCQDERLNYEFRKLHKFLVEQVIIFCKNNNITIDEFKLDADGLPGSIKEGSWQPCTDSGLTFMKYSDDYKKAFWEMDREFLKGKDRRDLDEIYLNQEPFMYSI